ncbi:MAG: potassium channel family protein [Parachlamydia sp.]|nr:potassium channel family protein [Parachlamydia sp.]
MNGVRPVWHPGGFVGLLFAVVAIFLVIPLLLQSFSAHLALQTGFTVLMASTLYTIVNRKVIWTLVFTLMIPFIVFDALSILYNSLFLMVVAYGFYCIFLLIAIIYLFKMMLEGKIIDTNLIFGALTLYLLAGILWAKLYFLSDCIFPGGFHGIAHVDVKNDGLGAGYENQFNLMYYSFTTLATLGLGDIVPIRHLAKTLTILEAIYGQLFVATVIAKVVSVWKKNTD